MHACRSTLEDPTVNSGDGKSTTVVADRWDYDQNDRLQFWKDGKVVAVFRWWDSIKAKD